MEPISDNTTLINKSELEQTVQPEQTEQTEQPIQAVQPELELPQVQINIGNVPNINQFIYQILLQEGLRTQRVLVIIIPLFVLIVISYLYIYMTQSIFNWFEYFGMAKQQNEQNDQNDQSDQNDQNNQKYLNDSYTYINTWIAVYIFILFFIVASAKSYLKKINFQLHEYEYDSNQEITIPVNTYDNCLTIFHNIWVLMGIDRVCKYILFNDKLYILLCITTCCGFILMIYKMCNFCTQFYCTYRGMNVNAANILYRNIQNIRTESLSDNEIERLDIILYRNLDQTDHLYDEKCAYCLVEFNESDDIHKYNCSHIFHVECSKMWLKIKGTCPTCRALVIPPQ